MNVTEAIHSRRNIKPELFNGKLIPEEDVNAILELANWAPNHGRTEPWRFFVFNSTALNEFATVQEEIYRNHIPKDKFKEEVAQKFAKRIDKVSHVIVIASARGKNPNIPVIEEVQATAIAVQNMWLGATERGIAMYWGSGGPTYLPEFKEPFGLGDEDQILGFLYLGYTDEKVEGVRQTGIDSKVTRVEFG
jgi:nitroreductase